MNRRSPSRPAVQVTCPGKLILSGEHAAVYGRPALVAAAGLPLVARFTPGVLPGVTLDIPQLGVAGTVPWAEVRAYTRAAREAWNQYAAAPSPTTFARVRGDDPSHLVKVALGETLEELGGVDPPPLHLDLHSELPLGSGFGSSAAAAVAIVTGLLIWQGIPASTERVLRLALEAERRQHGMPSGIDTTTVVEGGVLSLQRTPEGLAVERLAAGSLLSRIHAFGTGPPRESTGAVVAGVREWGAAQPAAFETVLADIAAATGRLRAEVEREREEPEAVLEAMRTIERSLETIGVVPADVRERVRQVECAGGAAKISGAGALTGPGGGTLLVYHPDPERIDSWTRGSGPLAEWPRYRAALGAPGAHLDPDCEDIS